MLNRIAPSSRDASKGSAKLKVAGLGAAIAVILEQYTSLPHDTIIAGLQILAILLGAMGVIDTANVWRNGVK